MALLYPIAPSQVDAKSPIDEHLMANGLKGNLEDLDSRIAGGGGGSGGGGSSFKVNGYLALLAEKPFTAEQILPGPAYRLDGALYSGGGTLSGARLIAEDMGSGGTLEADLLRYTKPNIRVTGLQRQFLAGINSIGRAGSALSTQSISRSATQIATQSISRWKNNGTIESILPLGGGQVRITISGGTIDSDYKLNDYVSISGATSANNNGNFLIVRVSDDGGNNVVINNPNAVLQTAASGTLELAAWKFTFINPVSTEFAAGENALFSGHTTPANNGSFPIYAANVGGNTLIVKSLNIVAQNAPAGTVDTNRWLYALNAPAPADYAVGESAEMLGHTASGNNGKFPITAVNFGGNNVVVYNANGVVQGGAAGSVNTLRWIYTFSVDPSPNVSVGDAVETIDATDFANRKSYVALQVNRAAGSNIVVYNANGVAQASTGGNMFSSRMLVKLAAPIPGLTTDSVITIEGTLSVPLTNFPYSLAPYAESNGDYKVLQVNRGGGSNYNAVIETRGPEQLGPGGRISLEGKSVFQVKPSITVASFGAGVVSSNGVIDPIQGVIPDGTLLMMALTSIPKGSSRNVTLQVG